MIVAGLTIACFAITNLPWQLDEFSQERQALASFDIVKEGQWLYQQAPREREATKPPLVPWISAGLFLTTRSWDFAWRFPSIAAALALAFLLWREGTKNFGAVAGMICLAGFGLNELSPRLATLVRTDMPLALITFAIGVQIWRKIRDRQTWKRRDRVLLFALLTIGVFTKGPILYVFLLPAIAAFQWRYRKERPGSAWSGWWPWLASAVLFSAWVAGGIITRAGFFDQVVMHEFLGRFRSADQRPHPPYYYFAHLLQKFAPWSELFLLFAVYAIRQNRGAVRTSWRRIPPEIFWLVCWSFAGLILMSAVPSKRLDRVFPSIPPLCLLIASQLALTNDRSEPGTRFVSRSALAALLFSIGLTSYYSITRVVRGFTDHHDALMQFGRVVRAEAAARRWRYEVVESHDGGMLLYLDRTHFVQPPQAVQSWQRGDLDALVIRVADAPAIVSQLPDATLSSIRSTPRKDFPNRDYVLVTRQPR